MFYRKNVGMIERILRAAAGAIMALCAVSVFANHPLKWPLLCAALITIITGLVGFCPACAVAGRRDIASR